MKKYFLLYILCFFSIESYFGLNQLNNLFIYHSLYPSFKWTFQKNSVQLYIVFVRWKHSYDITSIFMLPLPKRYVTRKRKRVILSSRNLIFYLFKIIYMYDMEMINTKVLLKDAHYLCQRHKGIFSNWRATLTTSFQRNVISSNW